MFPTAALQNDAVKQARSWQTTLQIFMLYCSLCIVLTQNNLFLARLPGIAAIWMKIIHVVTNRLWLIFQLLLIYHQWIQKYFNVKIHLNISCVINIQFVHLSGQHIKLLCLPSWLTSSSSLHFSEAYSSVYDWPLQPRRFVPIRRAICSHIRLICQRTFIQCINVTKPLMCWLIMYTNCITHVNTAFSVICENLQDQNVSIKCVINVYHTE